MKVRSIHGTNSVVLYDEDIIEKLPVNPSKWSDDDFVQLAESILGVVDYRINKTLDAIEIEAIKASSGYGMILFETLLSAVYPKGVITDRTGRVTEDAKRFHKKLLTNINIRKEKLGEGDDNDPDNFKYFMNVERANKSNLSEEVKTLILEEGDTYLRHGMQEIYGSTASVQASDIRALETRLAEKYKDVLKLSGNGKVPVLYLVPYADYGAFKLDSIEIKEELQGQGWGSKILKEICDFADQNNLIIVLTPAEKKTAKLVKWYKSFGFLENKGRNKDFRWAIRMIRYPHGMTRSKWIDANQKTSASKSSWWPKVWFEYDLTEEDIAYLFAVSDNNTDYIREHCKLEDFSGTLYRKSELDEENHDTFWTEEKHVADKFDGKLKEIQFSGKVYPVSDYLNKHEGRISKVYYEVIYDIEHDVPKENLYEEEDMQVLINILDHGIRYNTDEIGTVIIPVEELRRAQIKVVASNDYEEVERIRLKCYPGIDKEYFHNTLNKLLTEREMESFVGKHNDQGESLKGIQNSYRYLQGNRPAEVDKGLQNYGSDFDMGTNVFASERKMEIKFRLETIPGQRKSMIDMLEDLSNLDMVYIGRIRKYNTPGVSGLEVHVKEANEKAYREIKAYLNGYLEVDDTVEVEIDEPFYTDSPLTVAKSSSFEKALEKVKENFSKGHLVGFLDPNKFEDDLREELQGLSGKPIYRAVKVDHENQLDPNRIGIYWTWDKDKATTYWGEGNIKVTLESEASDEIIDWEATIEQWLKPQYNGECEVRLKPKSKVQVDRVWVGKIVKDKKFTAVADVDHDRCKT